MSQIVYLETCNSQYFQGFSGQTLAVPVDALTTKEDLRQGIIDEINSVTDEDTFSSHKEMEAAVDEVMEIFLTDHPFADIGDDLDMPKGYFEIKNDDNTWSLYEGNEDDMENADLIEEDLSSRAAALITAHDIMGTLEISVYAYFGIKED